MKNSYFYDRLNVVKSLYFLLMFVFSAQLSAISAEDLAKAKKT